ncbi:MAG: haloacid dehalogenase type II [Janthinobacterium lividum]
MLFSIPKPKLLIFDVNGTLLNMENIKLAINKVYQHPGAFTQWFSWLLQYTLVDTVTKSYHPFSEIAKASLQMTAKSLEVTIDEAFMQDILKSMQQLPLYPDVLEGLNMLKNAGYKMVTLTNSAPSAQQKQLEFTQITSYFAETFSVDQVKLYKPHPKTYQYVLDEFALEPDEALLIAAHGWDIAGAKNAGLQAAYIARKEQALYPLADEPQFVCRDLIELATKLAQL